MATRKQRTQRKQRKQRKQRTQRKQRRYGGVIPNKAVASVQPRLNPGAAPFQPALNPDAAPFQPALNPDAAPFQPYHMKNYNFPHVAEKILTPAEEYASRNPLGSLKPYNGKWKK